MDAWERCHTRLQPTSTVGFAHCCFGPILPSPPIENELYLLVSMWLSEGGWALESAADIDFYQRRGHAEVDEQGGCQQAPILPWFLLGLIPFVTRRKQNSTEA